MKVASHDERVPTMTELTLIKQSPDPESIQTQYPGLYIYSGLGRLMRPVRNLLFNQIEQIGIFEQVYLSVVIDPEEAEAGVPIHAWQTRSDNKMYKLQTPQKPLLKLEAHDKYEMDEYPLGTNACVAVISYTGYDMEDAMVINKASYQRGLGIKKTWKWCFWGKPNERGYGIGADGLPIEGRLYHQGDCYYGTFNLVSGQFHEHKFMYSEPAFCGLVRIVQEPDHKNHNVHALIQWRIQRNPIIGDKFASRHGQKGINSFLWPPESLPFSESGMVPDIIFNPHGFPSRMTIGMMIESMAGKAAAMHGASYDASPFVFNEENTAIEHFGKLLAKSGYNYYGNETMYSGVDGREMQVQIFFGIVYYQRLRHMIADKFQVRSTGPVDPITLQPIKGRKKGGGIRFGEMERDALIAHGAAFCLQDRLFNCSDRDEAEVCARCGSIVSVTRLRPHIAMAKYRMRPHQTQKFTRSHCSICLKEDQVFQVQVPRVFRYLCAELGAVNVKVQLSLSHPREALVGQVGRKHYKQLTETQKQKLARCLDRIEASQKEVINAAKCLVESRKRQFGVNRMVERGRTIKKKEESKVPSLVQEGDSKVPSLVQEGENKVPSLVQEGERKVPSLGDKENEQMSKTERKGSRLTIWQITNLLVKLIGGRRGEQTNERWQNVYGRLRRVVGEIERRNKFPGSKVFEKRMYDIVLDREEPSMSPEDRHSHVGLLQDGLKLIDLAIANRTKSSLHNVRLFSPRFMPLTPDKGGSLHNNSLLSPTLLAMYDEHDNGSIGNVPEAGVGEEERLGLIGTLMDVMGTTDKVEQTLEMFRDLNVFNEGNLGHIQMVGNVRAFFALEDSLDVQQKEQCEQNGYTFARKEQIEKLLRDQAVDLGKLPELARFDVYDRMSLEEKEFALWASIEQIASGSAPGQTQNDTMDGHLPQRRVKRTFAARVREPVILSPFAFTPIHGLAVLGPTILSPNSFSPSVLAPTILSPHILSPNIFRPQILSPTLMSPAILSPFVAHPYVLSPGLLGSLILNPVILTPFILTPVAISPSILNPFALSPAIFSPLREYAQINFDPWQLSKVLAPDIVSPQTLGGAIFSPVMLSPAILTQGYLMVSIFSPSFLS
uniref:DNA-directed RNA polymerase n=1 Tax=Globodera pallida TaxID=36090 RepID=A0A183BY36_GLOPA